VQIPAAIREADTVKASRPDAQLRLQLLHDLLHRIDVALLPALSGRLGGGDTIQLAPPFISEMAELDRLISVLADALAATA
jgi:adenosylmethionine-8-amino-7-oxononanoate aminotransferase